MSKVGKGTGPFGWGRMCVPPCAAMKAAARLASLVLLLPFFAACAPPAGSLPPNAPAGAAPGAASGPVDPATLFDGCTASPLSGVGWSYDCGGVAATVTDAPAGATIPDLLDGTETGFRASVKSGKVEAAAASYEIAGHKADGRHFTITVDGNKAAGADAAAYEVQGKGVRLLSCGGSLDAATRCHAMLEKLADEEWRGDALAGVKVKSDAVTLAGRPIAPPAGCDATKQGEGAMIRCDRTPALWWVENPADANAARENILAKIPGKRGKVACKVESTSKQCDVISDETGAIYAAQAKLRGHTVVLFCLAPKKAMPAACKGVISVSGAR
jgi:hypothetical protein